MHEACPALAGGRPRERRSIAVMAGARLWVDQLNEAARYYEHRGDTINAIAAYRQLVLSGDGAVAAMARERLRALAGGRVANHTPLEGGTSS